MASANEAIATAGNFVNVRKRHKNLTGKIVTAVRFGFVNAGIAGSGANIAERAIVNAIKVKTAAEFEGTPTVQNKPRTPGYFGAAQLATLETVAPGASPFVLSEEMHGVVLPDAYFFERTGVTVGTNAHVVPRGGSVRGGTSDYGTDTGEGRRDNSAAERVYDGSDIDIASSLNGYSASVVLGHLQDGSIARSVALCGDSIITGSDDAAYSQYVGGWALRAFSDVPHVLLGFPGEQMQNAIIRSNFYTRWRISAFATTVIWAYGRNDLGIGSRSAAQIKADFLTAASMFMLRGQHFIVPTILPAPTSSDGFKLAANQTPDASTEAARLSVNQWLRDATATGFVEQAKAQVAAYTFAGGASIIDICAPVETNAAGALAVDGGRILSEATVIDSGTATAGTTSLLTDSAKVWTVNTHKGKAVYISGGTGAGQSRCIGYNTATQLAVATPFSPAPDNTSTYQIINSYGMTGVHPMTRAHVAIATSIDVTDVMNRV